MHRNKINKYIEKSGINSHTEYDLTGLGDNFKKVLKDMFNISSSIDIEKNGNDEEYDIIGNGLKISYEVDPTEHWMKIRNISVERNDISGFDIFYELIKYHVSKDSIDRIDADLRRIDEGNNKMNGYYSLARYGFTEKKEETQRIYKKMLENMSGKKASTDAMQFIQKIGEVLNDGYLLYTLMNTKRGRKIWYMYGDSYDGNMIFEASHPSQMLFNQYCRQRGMNLL